MDTLWQVLSGPTKCNTESQLETIEGITINAEANFGASLAHDVQVALMLILNCIEEVDIEEITNIGLLSQDSIMKFLRLTHPEAMDEDLMHDILMAQELVFQQTLMDRLQRLDSANIIELRAMKQFAQNGGVSNIGIDLANC